MFVLCVENWRCMAHTVGLNNAALAYHQREKEGGVSNCVQRQLSVVSIELSHMSTRVSIMCGHE